MRKKVFYRKGRWQIPKYVLLRIDLSQRNSESVKINYGDNITVEHILPRRANNEGINYITGFCLKKNYLITF